MTPKKILVVYAHPNPESFNAAIKNQVEGTLVEAGHEVNVLDLYQQNFSATMTLKERLGYMTSDNTTGIEQEVCRLRWAEALVLVYPTWWSGPPAILKGWLDRVWLPGVAAKFNTGVVEPGLTKIRTVVVITTQGSSWWRMKLIGNPPRKMMKLCIRACTRFRRFHWLALYRMDKNTQQQREQFLLKLKTRLPKLLG